MRFLRLSRVTVAYVSQDSDARDAATMPPRPQVQSRSPLRDPDGNDRAWPRFSNRNLLAPGSVAFELTALIADANASLSLRAGSSLFVFARFGTIHSARQH